MYIHKSFIIPLFSPSSKSRIHVIVSDRKNWNKMTNTLNLFNDYDEEEPYSYDEVAAFFTQTQLKGITNFWIIFKQEPEYLTINSMTHEITHMVNAILKNRGVHPSFDNDETQAYLTGWVSETVYKILKKFIKK